jgi:hypothetical protein
MVYFQNKSTSMATGNKTDYSTIKHSKLQHTVQTAERKPSFKEFFSLPGTVLRTPIHQGDSKDFHRKMKSQFVREKPEVSTMHHTPFC